MGVYLPNVDMPKGDEVLTIQICPDGSIWQQYRGTIPNAKAVLVPPHGRLIDADAFIKRMEGLVHQAEADGFDLGAVWYTAFIRQIELASTVIEAEEGET